jgi:hypothetical protein
MLQDLVGCFQFQNKSNDVRLCKDGSAKVITSSALCGNGERRSNKPTDIDKKLTVLSPYVRNLGKQKENSKIKLLFNGKRRPTKPIVKRGRRAIKPSILSTCELAISSESEHDDEWVEIK